MMGLNKLRATYQSIFTPFHERDMILRPPELSSSRNYVATAVMHKFGHVALSPLMRRNSQSVHSHSSLLLVLRINKVRRYSRVSLSTHCPFLTHRPLPQTVLIA